jgi:hypothetical protein
MGTKGVQGVLNTPHPRGLQGFEGGSPREKKFGLFLAVFCVCCLAVFWHMVFADGFLILVKELGLLTNMGQWIMHLGVVGSYMYIVL